MTPQRLVSCLAITLFAVLLTGCGLYKLMTHDPTEDLKDAATDLSSDMKVSAKELGAGLRESSEQNREEIQAVLRSFAEVAKSGEHFVAQLTNLQNDLTKEDGFLTQQRIAILEELRKERVAISATISRERQAAMQDLDAFSTKMIGETSSQLRSLVPTALWLVILLVVVLFGLPFGAGILIGRLMRKPILHPAPPAIPSDKPKRHAHQDQLQGEKGTASRQAA